MKTIFKTTFNIRQPKYSYSWREAKKMSIHGDRQNPLNTYERLAVSWWWLEPFTHANLSKIGKTNRMWSIRRFVKGRFI